MFLKPRNQSELVDQLKGLPAEKRRVVVLVGRHPNEGTINLAKRHHAAWEEHGVVVVRIPAKWTPHWIWKQIAKSNADPVQLQREPLAELKGEWKPSFRPKNALADLFEVPVDKDITGLLAKEGVHSTVVSFHSTFSTEYAYYPKLEVSVGKEPALHIKEAAEADLPIDPGKVTVDSWGTAPNSVLVEFKYPHSPREKPRKTSIVTRKFHNNPFIIGSPSGQLSHSYLEHPTISKKALDYFSKEFNPWFTSFLK